MKLGFLVSAVPSKCIFSDINLFFFSCLDSDVLKRGDTLKRWLLSYVVCFKLEDHPDGASFCLLKLQNH